MKKILSILGTLGLVSSSVFTVIACENKPEPTKPEEGGEKPPKPDLTDELLEKFIEENNEISYSGEFLFDQGSKVDFSERTITTFNENVIIHLAMENFYKKINENYSYKGYHFLGTSAKIADNGNKVPNIDPSTTLKFEIGFLYRSPGKEPGDNRGWEIVFNFNQTKQFSNDKLLNEIFDSHFQNRFYKNNEGLPTFISEHPELYKLYTNWSHGEDEISPKKLEEFESEEEKLNYLTDGYSKIMNDYPENKEGKSIGKNVKEPIINKVKIEVKGFKKILPKKTGYPTTYIYEFYIELSLEIEKFKNTKFETRFYDSFDEKGDVNEYEKYI